MFIQQPRRPHPGDDTGQRKHVLRSCSSWSSASTKVDLSLTSPTKKGSAQTQQPPATSVARRKSAGVLNYESSTGMSAQGTATAQEGTVDVLFEFPAATLYKLPVSASTPRRDYDSPPPLPPHLTTATPTTTTSTASAAWQVARGKLRIYQIQGQPTPCYIQVGAGFVHPVLPKLRVWRVARDQFVMPQPNPGSYWRLEVKGLAEGEKEGEKEMEKVLEGACAYQCTYEREEGSGTDEEEEEEEGERMSVSVEWDEDDGLDLELLGFPLSTEAVHFDGYGDGDEATQVSPQDYSQALHTRTNVVNRDRSFYAQTDSDSSSSSSTLDLILDDFVDDFVKDGHGEEDLAGLASLDKAVAQLHRPSIHPQPVTPIHNQRQPTTPTSSSTAKDTDKGSYWQTLSKALAWTT